MTDPAMGKRQLSLEEMFARVPTPGFDHQIKCIDESLKEGAIASAITQAPSPSDFERTWPRPKVACVDCGGLMVLRWGEERRPHFAHLNSSRAAAGCCGGESLMHRLAKTLLARHLNANRRVRLRYNCPRCMRQATYDLDLATLPNALASEEYTLESGARVDVCVHALGASPVLAIEIFQSHRSLTAPRRDLLWFEIRAEHVITALESDINATLVELECQRKDRDRCNNAMCIGTYEIAKQLGYRLIVSFYENDNLREKDEAIRGEYRLPLEVWQTSPDERDVYEEESETNDDGCTQAYDVDDLWHEFVQRRHCMRCLRSSITSRHRPFCLRCYKLTRRENETDDFERCEWRVVDGSRKAHLREKFKWLKYFQTSSPGMTCQVCESDAQGCTWWFGNRRICKECFAAWTPDKTQSYLCKVYPDLFKVEGPGRRAAQAELLRGL